MKASAAAASRRSFIAATSLSALASLVTKPASAQAVPSKTFVFAHGSWHGGWSWQRVADRLRAQGHRAFTPSFTGMGDREHLLSKEITIDTFVKDLTEVIKTEELSDVILVAHSFGGVPITGVADRMPERLRHLVYLDSIVLENGKTGFSVYPTKEAEDRIAAANTANGGVAVPIPKTLPAAWGFKEGTADYAWVLRRITPTPLNAYLTALDLQAPFGNGVPKTYIHCTKPENPVIEGSRALVRSQPNWTWIDFPGPHDSMITDPDGIVNLLLQV